MEISAYEQERLNNIVRNNEVLASLGLLEPGLLLADEVRTPPPVRAKRERHAAEATQNSNPTRGLRPKRSTPTPSGCNAAEQPRRRSKREEKSDAGLGGKDGGFATPKRGAVFKETKRPHAARARPELSLEEMAALADHLGATGWLEMLERDFLREPETYTRFWRSPANEAQVQAVMSKLIALASGEGVRHPTAKKAPPFMQGEPLTLEHDLAALLEQADEWTRRWGPDMCNGWSLSQPLKRMNAFQTFITGGFDMAAHLEPC
ncbi:hypothetical protein T492DRAFT_989868 [Pavlovales sp. CCMP2436]|nr:hypothetical protein T492DRAFT_989868 [Pavlovales sp. CCMP2436]